MALITLPAIEAVSVRPRLIRGDVPLEKLGGGVVIVAPPYALWTLSIPLATQTLSGNARAWFAALAQLSKLSNTCKIMPPGFVNGANYTGANPLVNGAGQLGLTLAADGLPAFTLVARAGDFLEVNVEFKLLTADATTNGAGQVTFNFEPALRAAPADNATIDIKTPKMMLRLALPIAEWEYRRTSLRHDISLELVESF